MQISIANIIRGTLIGNTMSVLTRYISRVVNGGGIVESPQCVETALNSQSILQQASLLVVPSGYKGGTLYSEIPTNGNGDLTWTRGSDAFRTNASGLIQRVPWNLITYSEEFNNGAWTKVNATITTNTTTAPNGTLTADKLTATATTSTHILLQQPAGSVSGATSTLSIYAKSAELSNIQFLNNAGGLGVANFDLSAGTAVLVHGVSASIENVGNGWYRCIMTYTPTTSGIYNVQIRLADSSGNTTFLGNGTDGVFLWGAQLVQGTTAQTYLPTTDRLNFPRLSYMYGSCPSALLEPQRTNLALYSQQMDDASWGKINSSVTANSTTAPDGTTNADTFTADGTNNQHYIVGTTSGNITSGTTYTYTIYAKKNTNNFIQLWIGNAFGGMFANFDLNNGVVGTLGIGSGGSNPTSSIQSVGNGWYRCSMTFVPTSTGVVGLLCIITTSASAQRAEANTLSTSVYLFGAQLEAGAYPTTYIPTTSATATRVADSFSRSNIYTNGLITSSGGTWFVELRNNISYVRDGISRFGIGDTSAINLNSLHIGSLSSTTTRQQIYKTVAGSYVLLYTTLTDTVKIAIKWNGTSADVFVNGTKVVSATSFTTTNMELLKDSGGLTAPTFIQQMALFPTPLSDTDCATITSL